MNKFLPPIEYFITIFVCVTAIAMASILAGWSYNVTKTYVDAGFVKRYNCRNGGYYWTKPSEKIIEYDF